MKTKAITTSPAPIILAKGRRDTLYAPQIELTTAGMPAKGSKWYLHLFTALRALVEENHSLPPPPNTQIIWVLEVDGTAGVTFQQDKVGTGTEGTDDNATSVLDCYITKDTIPAGALRQVQVPMNILAKAMANQEDTREQIRQLWPDIAP